MRKIKGSNNDPLDISDAPDFHLLSDAEKSLCEELRIYPKPFICIKELIFTEILKNNGRLNIEKCNSLIKLEEKKASKIYDYFVKQNWCQLSN